jgi:riboflavin kinase/FMN adenylyltransferase
MCDKKENLALALGYFDGLHIAHQKVLSAALEQQKNALTPAVLLFDRHPASVLTGIEVPRLLTDADRDALLASMGILPVKLCFAEIKDLTPEAFVEEILCERLSCAFVSCGFNYRFGKGGAGTAELLQTLCEAKGIDVSVSPQVTLRGEPVSSSAIRRAVAAGETEKAVAMLGRPLTFTAPVFSGDHRGRTLGTPTVNQYLPEGFVTPAFGVYASVTEINGVRCPSVTNIGSRPTFGGGTVRSETHIIGFSGDLYGRTLRVELLSFLRPEMKFASADALREQISRDARRAEEAVKSSPFFQK